MKNSDRDTQVAQPKHDVLSPSQGHDKINSNPPPDKTKVSKKACEKTRKSKENKKRVCREKCNNREDNPIVSKKQRRLSRRWPKEEKDLECLWNHLL